MDSVVYFSDGRRSPLKQMNKSQLFLILFLVCFVAAMWLLVFNFSVVPAHYRDPFGTQAAPVE